MNINLSNFLIFVKSKKHLAKVEEMKKPVDQQEALFQAGLLDLCYLDDDEFEDMLLLASLPPEAFVEPTLNTQKISSIPENKPKKKKGKKNQQETIVNASVPYKKGMSVLDVIEKMNSQNMTGRKARHLDDDIQPKKKGKKHYDNLFKQTNNIHLSSFVNRMSLLLGTHTNNLTETTSSLSMLTTDLKVPVVTKTTISTRYEIN